MCQPERTRTLCALILMIARSFVDHPDAVSVTAMVTATGGRTTVYVSVSSFDIGEMIGRNGRIVDAIRQYIRAYEKQHGGSYGLSIQSH